MHVQRTKWPLLVCSLIGVSCSGSQQLVEEGPGADELSQSEQSLVPDDLVNGIALTGPAGWTTLPTAIYSNDEWTVTNAPVGDNFGPASATAGVHRLTGDFDGNGSTDVALAHSSWDYIHIAYGSAPFPVDGGVFNGGGQFTVVRESAFGGWASYLAASGARVVTGDFNADGKTDLAVTGGVGWRSIPVAFLRSRRFGFDVQNSVSSDLNSLLSHWGTSWSRASGVEVLTGDFDCDNDTDLALVGVVGWATIPIARSNRDGTWTVQNPDRAEFAEMSARPGVKRLVGQFSSDACADIALVGSDTFFGVPLASGHFGGSFAFNETGFVGGFKTLASLPNAKVVAGKFDGDARTDLAILGLSGTGGLLPVAFSDGFGTFRVTSFPVTERPFVEWSAAAPTVLVADFNRDGKSDIGLVGVATWNTIPVALNLGNGHFLPRNPSAIGTDPNVDFANLSSLAPSRFTGRF